MDMDKQVERKIYVVKAEYRSSDGMIAIFESKEKAEKCYEDNLPQREHDAVEFYEVVLTDGEAYCYYPDKSEEK